jgi:hypothetical protein
VHRDWLVTRDGLPLSQASSRAEVGRDRFIVPARPVLRHHLFGTGRPFLYHLCSAASDARYLITALATGAHSQRPMHPSKMGGF